MYYIYNKQNCNLLFTTDDMSKLKGVIILENCIVTNIPYAYPIEKNDEIIEANKIDLYKKGIYKLQDGEIIEANNVIYIPEPNDGYPYKWNNNKWVKVITPEEEVEQLKKQIIDKTREIEMQKLAGFRNMKLETELKTLKQNHFSKSHVLALEIDKRM